MKCCIFSEFLQYIKKDSGDKVLRWSERYNFHALEVTKSWRLLEVDRALTAT